MDRKTTVPFLLCFCGLLLAPSLGMATSYNVTIDTAAIAGTPAQIAFDFIDGGPDANSVTLSSFTTNGTLGAQSIIGSVTGALPGDVTLNDPTSSTSFSRHHLGNQISFLFTPTSNPPASGSVPDAFSVFLLDPVSGLSLVATSDPTGADALFRFDIDGTSTGALSIFATQNGDVGTSVTEHANAAPEPSVLALLVAGLLAGSRVSSHRRRSGAALARTISPR